MFDLSLPSLSEQREVIALYGERICDKAERAQFKNKTQKNKNNNKKNNPKLGESGKYGNYASLS